MTSKISKTAAPFLPYRKILPEGFVCPEPKYRVDSLLQSEHIDESGHLLRNHFAGQSTTLVDTGGFVFYDPDDLRRRRFRPDLYIVFGVDAASILQRNGYVIEEAGKPPDFVLEVASPTTYRHDLRNKPGLYARVGVGEYWRFDPTGGDLYGRPLAGDLLVQGAYRPLEIVAEEDGMTWGHSPALDLCLCSRGERLLFYDHKTGRYLTNIREETAAHRQTAAQRDAEIAARLLATAERDAALAEAERLREELRRLRGE